MGLFGNNFLPKKAPERKQKSASMNNLTTIKSDMIEEFEKDKLSELQKAKLQTGSGEFVFDHGTWQKG